MDILVVFTHLFGQTTVLVVTVMSIVWSLRFICFGNTYNDMNPDLFFSTLIQLYVDSPKALKKFLLYVRRTEIRGVDLDNPYLNIMTALTVPDIDDVTVVDYDALEERIYWADVKTQTIKRAFINGTGLETVISGGVAHTIR